VVVEDGVEAELREPRRLRGGARAADHAGAAAAGQLTGETPDGAGGARDEDRVALFHLADVGDADVGGQPRHAEDAQRGRQRRRRGIDLAGSRPVHERGLTPAEIVYDPRSLGHRVAP
jgi:hypothetical protein